MADSARLPGSHYWPGLPTPFWQWFRQVDAAIGSGITVTVDVAAIDTRLTAVEAAVADIAAAPVYTGFGGVRVSGHTIRLLNDVSEPDASSYYGTDDTGEHGWHAHAVSTLADVDLTGLVADDVLRWNGTAWVRQPVSDFIATLLDDADAPTALSTLGAQPVFGATHTSATGGAASALPALPSGYVEVDVGGVTKRVPYYD